MPDPTGKKTRLMIVDDHAIVRQGLRTLLELQDDMEVVAEAADGQQAVTLAAQHHPDVVLMDLVMPVLDGISATRQICALRLPIRVIALTSFAEDEQVIPAIQAGADSFILKDIAPGELIETVRAVARGEARLHSQAARKLMDQVSRPAIPSAARDLTERELDVLRLVAQGLTNRQIGEQLFISEKTVKTHVSNLLGKLGLDDRTQLAVYAIKMNLAPG